MMELHLKNYAYLGDAVWELYIREITIEKTQNAKELHKITTDKVKASFQCELLNKIEDVLTEEEKDLSRRARNLSIPIGRRSNQGEYRQATAFEALIGWWHTHDVTRLNEMYEKISQHMDFN